jgi:hypothetical protein
MENRGFLAQQLIKWSLIDKRKKSLDQLKRGLNHVGFLKAARSNPLILKPLLVYSSKYSITGDYLRAHLLPAVRNLSTTNTAEVNAKEFADTYISEMTGRLLNIFI